MQLQEIGVGHIAIPFGNNFYKKKDWHLIVVCTQIHNKQLKGLVQTTQKGLMYYCKDPPLSLYDCVKKKIWNNDYTLQAGLIFVLKNVLFNPRQIKKIDNKRKISNWNDQSFFLRKNEIFH